MSTETRVSRQLAPVDPQKVARFFAYIRLVGDISIFLVIGYFIIGLGDWRGYVASAIVLAITISSIIATRLVRASKTEDGIKALVWGFAFGILAISTLVAGLGFFSLVACILLTALMVVLTVPGNTARQLIISSIIIGLAAFLFDAIVGERGFRLIIYPEVELAIKGTIWGAVVLIALLYSVPLLQNFHNLALQPKIFLSYTLVAVTSLGIIGGYSNVVINQTLTDEASKSLLTAAEQTARDVEDFLLETLSTVDAESKFPAFTAYVNWPYEYITGTDVEFNAFETLRAIAGKGLNADRILAYFLLDTEGTILTSSSYVTPVGFAGINNLSPYIDIYKNTVSDVVVLPSGKTVLFFSSPFYQFGERRGILAVAYDANVLQDVVIRNNDIIGENSFAMVFDEYSILLAHGADPSIIYTPIDILNATELAELNSASRMPRIPLQENYVIEDLAANLKEAQTGFPEEHTFTAQAFTTEDRVHQVAVVPLKNDTKPWAIVFFQPRDIFLAPIRSLSAQTTLISMGATGIVFLVATMALRYMSRPILNLTSTAERIAQGDFTARAEVESLDEIGALATTLNTMTAQLNALVTDLEAQVAQRTQALERRTRQIQAAAEIARDATAESELHPLLYQSVNLLSGRLDFYHTGIYLINQTGEFAALMAATGTAGQLLLQSEHHVLVGSDNPIGQVTHNGIARITMPGGEHEPTLSETQSQLTLPLRVGDRLLGALDIHSHEPNVFHQDELDVFRIMADQFAVAIQKAQLGAEVEQTLRELENAYGRFTRDAWRSFAYGSEHPLGYRFHQLQLEPTIQQSDEALAAWKSGETLVAPAQQQGDIPTTTLAVPIKIRGQVAGVLDIKFAAPEVSQTSQQMLEEIATRLSLVLENARLVEAAQRRVQLERLGAQVTGRIRETLNIDTILMTAVEEIGKSFALSEVEIRLGAPAGQDGNGGAEPFDDHDLDLDTLLK